MSEFFGYFEEYYVNLKFGALYVIQMCCFTLLITLAMNPMKWDWRGIVVKICDLVMTFIVQILVFCFIEYFFGQQNENNYVAWAVVVAIHMLCFCKYDIFNQISKGLVVYIFIILFPQVSANLNTIINEDQTVDFMVVSLICMAILLPIWIFMLIYTSSKKGKTNFIYFGLIVFVMAFSIMVIITDTTERDYIDNIKAHFYLYLVLLVLSLISYYLFSTANKYYSKQYEDEVIALKYESDKKLVDFSKQNLEDLRKVRHDMKNQYRFMKTFIDNDDMEGFKKYFYELRDSQGAALVDTNNKLINLKLYELNKMMEQEGISLIFSSNDLSSCNLSVEKLNEIIYFTNQMIVSNIGEDKTVNMDMQFVDSTLLCRLNFEVNGKFDEESFRQKYILNLVDLIVENNRAFITGQFKL